MAAQPASTRRLSLTCWGLVGYKPWALAALPAPRVNLFLSPEIETGLTGALSLFIPPRKATENIRRSLCKRRKAELLGCESFQCHQLGLMSGVHGLVA